ncbi:MAG: hypothetical protein MJ246_00935 [Clostridia bacterium]|nr:hypothetical protein [Clostridia bacterium]
MIEGLTSGSAEMNSCQILADTYDPNSAVTEITTVPFCADKRVVVFENCDVFNKEELKDLFMDIPEETVVIVIQEGLKNVLKDDSSSDEDTKTKWSLKDLKDINYVKIDFDGEKGQILSSKIREWASLENVKIDKVSIDYLISCCGTDSAQLRNEVSKLCSYVLSSGRSEVSNKDINDICTFKLEVDIFDLTNKIEEKKAAEAVSKYKDLIARGNKPVQLLTILFNRFELLYEVKLAMSDKDSNAKLSEVFGDKKGYYVDKTKAFASKISMKDLKEILNLINENYLGTFQGNDDTETLIYEIIGKMK